MENEIGKVIGSDVLICDHCRKLKSCEKIIYNKFGNVIFICNQCKKRC